MNTHTAKALVQDAFYQVLDNKVFRLLVIVCMCTVAFTFLVGFTPDGISLLFGAWKFTYAQLGVRGAGTGDAQLNVRLIQGLQSLFVNGFVGDFGILISLAATAFFVPRMLEKGEADTLFSKPVGRFVLLFARYITGVVFVGVLALLLVGGMHVGLLVSSGYSDPGFLWGALTLVYVFALVHAFSTAMGVFTRSSVAALLLSIMFFWINGPVVQQLWMWREHRAEVQRLRAALDKEDAVAKAAEENSAFLEVFFVGLDTLHYVLPKTQDADILTRKLRTIVAGGPVPLIDPVGKLVISKAPSGLKREATHAAIDLLAVPISWTDTENGRVAARITIARRSRVQDSEFGGQVRTTRTTVGSAANEFAKSLETRSEVEGKVVRTNSSTTGLVRERVSWREQGATGAIARERAFLAIDDWMYEIDLEADQSWLAAEGHESVVPDFLGTLKTQRDSALEIDDSAEWYARHFGWTAPLKFNAFFSIGTSILFAAAVLLLARWRLSRIDF